MNVVDNSHLPIAQRILLMLKFASNPYVNIILGNKNKN